MEKVFLFVEETCYDCETSVYVTVFANEADALTQLRTRAAEVLEESYSNYRIEDANTYEDEPNLDGPIASNYHIEAANTCEDESDFDEPIALLDANDRNWTIWRTNEYCSDHVSLSVLEKPVK